MDDDIDPTFYIVFVVFMFLLLAVFYRSESEPTPPAVQSQSLYDPAKDPIAQLLIAKRNLREAAEERAARSNAPSFQERMHDKGIAYCRDNANKYYDYNKCRRDWNRPFN